jgi:hypothetical protein
MTIFNSYVTNYQRITVPKVAKTVMVPELSSTSRRLWKKTNLSGKPRSPQEKLTHGWIGSVHDMGMDDYGLLVGGNMNFIFPNGWDDDPI